MHPTTRPRTSKPRGLCQYYNTPRGCFAGNKCKFLHGEEGSSLTPYDNAKHCRFYAQGFCKRGDACWFIHALEPKSEEDDEDELCSICFEKPSTYGLLGGCSHIFCTTCIKQWRDPTNKPGGVLDSGNTKKCPMCRASSKFITPSSRFWKEGTEEKDRVVQAYKDSMARVPCRYFQKSLQKNKNKPLCPYGKDCFYQHLNDDGTPYIFKDGVDASMRKYSLNFPARGGLSFSFGSDDIHFMPFTSLLDTMTIPIPLPSARSPSRRDRERHVLDNFLRMQPRPGGSGTQPTQVDAQTQTSRRLHEVTRSLDMLHEAIGENGTSLEHLSDAVEALRAGLGGVEGGARLRGPRRDTAGAGVIDNDRWFAGVWDDPTGGEMTAEEEAARQEDVVMERLEELADQMLASIDALQRESRGLARATSPDNADDDNNGDMPPLEPIPHSDSEDSDDSSMPHLQSVSNTSESDDDDDVSDLDSEGFGGDSAGELWPWQRHLQRLGGNGMNTANNTANTNYRRRHQHRRAGGGGGGNANRNNTTPARAARPAATSGDASASSSENLNEDVTGPSTTTFSVPFATFTPPAITTTGSDPTSNSTASSSSPAPQVASPSPPPVKFEVEVEASSSSTSLSAPSMVAEPPFVTDGRGRVVWTSSSDEVSPSSSAVETRSRSPIRRDPSVAEVERIEGDRKVDSGANGGNNGCRDRSGDSSVQREIGVVVGTTDEGGANDGRRSGGGGSTLFDWFSSLF